MTNPTELGELFLQVSRQLRRHHRVLSIAPHQFRALHVIAREPIRPARLAEHLAITPRAVTDVVDTLVTEKLITTGPDPTDRRAKILTITDRGRDRLDRVREERLRIASEMFSRLSANEQAKLSELLVKVLD